MRFSYIVILVFIIFSATTVYVFFAPVSMKKEIAIEIPYGSSISKTGDILKSQKIIHSKDAYVFLIKIIHPKGIVAGRYSFSGNINLFSVVYRTSIGDFGRKQVRLTIPEGFTNEEIANRINALFPSITKIDIKNKLPSEGYVYPETYFFDPESNIDEIANTLVTKSTTKLTNLIDPVGLNTDQAKIILTKASLVEAEGRTKDERHMIAGIIENRLAINMPLQLDATLTYLTGKGSSELTLKDLKNPSPYNTYVNKGIPPAPINNPGEESINAVLKPKDSSFLYYLHDKNGNIHYAKTYQEHLQNKNKYLR
jgi:UPF0755 protein